MDSYAVQLFFALAETHDHSEVTALRGQASVRILAKDQSCNLPKHKRSLRDGKVPFVSPHFRLWLSMTLPMSQYAHWCV